MSNQVSEIAKIWPSIKHVFSVPHNEEEYLHLVDTLDQLIDEIGSDEAHPLSRVLETLGQLIESYEDQHLPQNQATPIESLNFLMQEHGLKQADLKEIGSQGVVSEVLAGKRNLNLEQIKNLSKRFNVSPTVFID